MRSPALTHHTSVCPNGNSRFNGTPFQFFWFLAGYRSIDETEQPNWARAAHYHGIQHYFHVCTITYQYLLDIFGVIQC